MIEEGGPLKGSRIVKAVIANQGNIRSLSHTTEQQQANLIATYVRKIRVICFNDLPWNEAVLHEMLQFGHQI